jgi:hypothetical protein
MPRPRFRWPELAVAGAVAAAAVAVVIGVTAGGSSERTIQASTRMPGSAARLTIGDGDALLRVSGMPVLRGDRVYEVWIEHDGRVRPAGALFEVHADGSGAAAIPHDLDHGDRVMVTRERAGGVAKPTETPIIVARA